MAETVFLGWDRDLPSLIAERLLRSARGVPVDLSGVLLTLPGQLARKKVLAALAARAPRGLLMPRIVTPAQLLRFRRDDGPEVSPLAEELLWVRAAELALRTPERFRLIFPEGTRSADLYLSGRKFREFRNEAARGGFSLADIAKYTGERGAQFAELEQLYLRELAACGGRDPLERDREDAADTAPFAEPGMRIILAGMPDLPNPLRTKLENIDRRFPDRIEIWIHAPADQAAAFDRWGAPDPEVWRDRALPIAQGNCHLVRDADHAAGVAARLAAGEEGLRPDRCAMVLADPGMLDVFRREFARFTSPAGEPLTLYDPAGVPMRKLRLCRLGTCLTEFLAAPGDFSCAAELLREHDYLLHLTAPERTAEDILAALDCFTARFVPDDLDRALALTRDLPPEQGGCLHDMLSELAAWPRRLNESGAAEFLREFFRTVYPPDPELDREMLFQTTFAAECAEFRKQLAELDRLPETLTGPSRRVRVLEIFFRNCAAAAVPGEPGEFSWGVEGCLEMPFLDAPRVIFCGLNEKFFPDRIEPTPFLTDSLRRRIGLRSNRETAARARCHLQSLLGCREPGAVEFLILRRDREKSVLRPSPLLFAGEDLPEDVLFERCRTLFADPPPPPELPDRSPGKVFRLRPALDYRRGGDGDDRPLLSPTDLDDYLDSPLVFFLRRVRKLERVDYDQEEPDARIAGTLYHAALETADAAAPAEPRELERHLLTQLERVLDRQFGPPPRPALIRLMAEAMRQRLKFAAAALVRERAAGFEPVVNEYKLDRVPLAGALFSGKIDRIEYNRSTGTLRIIDIKTGTPENIAEAHCARGRNGLLRFKKLQLPLYALLLRADGEFRRRFPDLKLDRIECGYLNLPRNVSATGVNLWDPEDFAAVLPDALRRTEEIVAEIRELPRGILHEDPDLFHRTKARDLHDCFPGGPRACLSHVVWANDASADPVEPETAPAPPRKRQPLPAQTAPVPPLRPPAELSPAAATRICDCPPEVQAACRCCRGNCADCGEFNGFRRFNLITASAGTGKTYRLASRFIQLLACHADPAQIMAVTFTKEAAGEIFDKIIARMLDLASRPGTGCFCIDRGKIVAMLRTLLNCERELQISTIDSFFMRLLKAFAPELGVWGEVSMLDPGDKRLVRRTFREWIRSISDPRQLDYLRELLKEANSSEDRNFAQSLQTLLHDVYPYYMLRVLRDRDGSMPQVRFAPWVPERADVMDAAALDEAAAALDGFAAELDDSAAFLTHKTKAASARNFAERLRALAQFVPRTRTLDGFGRLDDPVNELFRKLGEQNGPGWADAADGELRYTRDLAFRPECAALIRRVFRHIRAALYVKNRNKTAAVFELMREFDAVYDRVRRAGNLTFTDLPYLLGGTDPETRESVFGSHDRSLELRLDAEIRHYLFDEFQDTSDAQWRIFDGMVRELFSADREEFRSFFCVGDIKQSIYQWRDGDPGLFAYLTALATPAARLHGYDPRESLNRSYRSAQSVLDMVNGIFGSPYTGNLPLFSSVQKRMEFAPHIAAKTEMEGFAALIECERDPASGRNDGIQVRRKARIIFEILREIRPLKKNLTVGVLVQKNRTVELFSEELRMLAADAGADLPVSSEGRIGIGESMGFHFFSALITLASHPQDQSAREFLATVTFDRAESDPEPLGNSEILRRLGLDPAQEPASALRNELFRSGIGGLAERFLDGFGGEMTAFDLKRVTGMVKMAADFSGSPTDFIALVQETGSAAAAVDRTIQVMTFHKSKGLEFDIVFLPDICRQTGGGRNLLLPDAQIVATSEVYGESLPTPEWICYPPPAGVAAEIPPFAENAAKHRQDQAFESCCDLYVALTRAKRSLYVLISPSAAESKTMALDQIVREQLRARGPQADDLEYFDDLRQRTGLELTPHYTSGRRSWPGLIPESDAPPAFAAAAEPPRTVRDFAGSRTLRASDAKSSAITPAKRFHPPGGAEVGTLVHGLMEKIIRIAPDFDAKKFAADNLPDSPFAAAAAEIFTRALEAPSAIRTLLTDVPDDAEIWNERDFLSAVGNGTLIPGTFDRVAVFRRDGKPVRAEVFDWKTDNLASAEEFLVYAGQLKIYRRSLSRLLDLPESAVAAFICSLKLKQIIPVP